MPGAGVLVDGRGITLAALAERAGLREELALMDMRGLLGEDEELVETRAAVARALQPGGGDNARQWLDFDQRRAEGKPGRTLGEVLDLFDSAADALTYAFKQGVVAK